MTKRVLLVLAALMICLPVIASDVPAKIVGTWHGSWGSRDVTLVFAKAFFNLSIHDHDPEVSHQTIYACDFSGSYQISQNDELVITTRAADVAKDYGIMYSPKSCEHFPELKKNLEVNLGPVEFIATSGRPDQMMVNAGRLLVARQP